MKDYKLSELKVLCQSHFDEHGNCVGCSARNWCDDEAGLPPSRWKLESLERETGQIEQ